VTRAGAQPTTGRPGLLIHCLLAASLAGCGGGHPATRGFDSREVLPVRDSTLLLWSFSERSGEPLVIYSTVPAGTSDLNYWSLDVATGNVENLGPEQPASLTAASGPYACYLQSNTPSGTQVLQIYDLRTNLETDVLDVVSYAACPRSDGALAVFRTDPETGGPALWQGPFAQLQPVALSMDVEAVGQWLFDAQGTPTGVLVAAAPAEQPGAFGLYTLDLGSAAFTEDVPATPASTAWAAGALAGGSLQSTSLATGAAQSIRAIGDHFAYTRTMSDGTTTMFTGPFGAGSASELALFQAVPKAVSGSSIAFYTSSTYAAAGSGGPTVAAWSPASAAGDGSTLMVWDDDARVVVACPSSPAATLSGVVSPDGSRVVFSDFPASSPNTPSAVTLFSLGAATGGADGCFAVAAAGGTDAGFSTDGQSLYWTVASGPVNSELWASAGDGSSPRMIGSGALSYVHFLPSAGSQRLEFYLDNDFVWVDLKDDPITLHDVVQQVYEGYYDLGNSWLLIGYQFSTQDGTGTLGLVDRDTGATRSISPAVTNFRAARAAAPADAGASDAGDQPAYDVLYVVRGRNPSPQDGLWMARVNATDLQ
jgi:hypothetical protein